MEACALPAVSKPWQAHFLRVMQSAVDFLPGNTQMNHGSYQLPALTRHICMSLWRRFFPVGYFTRRCQYLYRGVIR
jgi:hypothetical protein